MAKFKMISKLQKLINKKLNDQISTSNYFSIERKFWGVLSYTIFTAMLTACGSNNKKTNETDNSSNIDNSNISNDPSPVPVYTSNITVREGETTFGISGVNDAISASSETFTTGTSIIDENPYDLDVLTVSATSDIVGTPIVSGIEKIIFTTNQNWLGSDHEFNIDVTNIDSTSTIMVENQNTSSLVRTVSISNISSKLEIGNHFTNVKINPKSGYDVDLAITSNMNISTIGNFNNLAIDGKGKDVSIISSTNSKDVIIENGGNVSLNTSSQSNIKITANGNVIVNDAAELKGNITVTSIGNISINNAPEASGSLILSNERAPEGSDVVIGKAGSFGNVNITSVGSITTVSSNGLESARIISATMGEDSQISSDGVNNQTIKLSTLGSINDTVKVVLNASELETLMLAGTAPIIVEISGDDISSETVTSTNSNAALNVISSNSDLSNVSKNINIWLENHDGKTIVTADGQKYFFDTEAPQTSNDSVLKFDHKMNATESSQNNLILKSHDTNTYNANTVANFSGLNFVDIQKLTFDTLTGVDFSSSADITGSDLKSIIFVGSGDLDIGSSTITGGISARVTFDGSSASGSVKLGLNSKPNAVANVKTGDGADLIKIDGITLDSNGYVLSNGGGNDTLHITANGDSSSAKIAIDGGSGNDSIKLESGVDLSLSTVSLSSIENIILESGGQTQKFAASDISGKSFSISDYGTGSSNFTIFADQTTINLSSLTFTSSFIDGTDKIIIDGSNSASGLSITGSGQSDNITGSNANDTIAGGSGNDTIIGASGNDIIEGQEGADVLTGGAGDDEFDFSTGASTEAKMDKITDYQAAAADFDNDKIDISTNSKGANTSSINVKSAISNGSGSEAVTASVAKGIVTISGSDAGKINTLSEWIAAVSVNGVIAKAADDADAVGTVAFQFSGNTYLVESQDAFDNNTPNVTIANVIELTGLTGITAIADAAAANTILIS